MLIDGIGALYSIPPVAWRMRRRGVRVERFLTSLIPWRMPYLNLRSHRKVMVVDGRIGFTGGMNIKLAHLLAESPPFPTPDVHFRIEGPAVADLMSVFADDWAFTCGEQLAGPAHRRSPSAPCRSTRAQPARYRMAPSRGAVNRPSQWLGLPPE